MKAPKKTNLINLTSVQLIVLYYLGAAILSTILLSLPYTHKPGVEWTFIDALFTAVSAISVTGLTVVSTAETFSTFGVFVLAFILQFGGVGIMTLGTFIWLMLGRKIGLRERQLIMTDQNRGTFSGLVHLMKQILSLILIIEAIGAIILGTYFLRYFPSWQEAFIQGFFASVSATTNAGFDITGESLIPFAHDYYVQTVNMVLLILGAIGFPVLIEVKESLQKRSKVHEPYKFSLFTKITTITFFSLTVIGALFIYLFERSHFFADTVWHETLFYSIFQSITTRNGGLATMDVSDFTVPTQLLLSTLMFIGASPSSVGGGIRTTTFAIVLLAIFSFARGRQSVKVFHRELDPEDVLKSFVVISVAVFITGSAVIALSIIEPFPLIAVIFEVCSAFGTTGLSMGITPDLSTPGKLIIIFLMFVGRIGVFSFLFIIRGKTTEDLYHYPKERVIIG
ncbi:TrkH family potassium uptake protein [Halalkalibacter urbisdiaboli]|uniref:TrkH family potassium uptake protein n=1 Tax=Halalkalibacter urbisdiaboli TaxID=1960589 RepID=UPI000B44A6DF|nr:TrkH family potassium uptake protein [Halalkalibacter urbisdiaboli]